MTFKVGDRVMIPRSSGKYTPGEVQEIWCERVKVKLDQKGRRGQDLGKIVWMDELRPEVVR